MRRISRTLTVLALLAIGPVSVGAAELAGTTWHLTMDTGRLGPVETFVRFEERDGELYGRSLSGALEEIRLLPGAAAEDVHLDDALFAVQAKEVDGVFVGVTLSPWEGREIRLSVSDDSLSGSIDGGLLGGSLEGVPVERPETIRDYPSLLSALHEVVAAKLFDPADLAEPGYEAFRQRMEKVAETASDDLDFLLGLEFAWTNDPFSHFDVRRSEASAEAMMRYFDDFRVGQEAARVTFDGDLAVLRVDTMMGNDTIEQIRAAYAAIHERGSKALLIDLRGNEGGVFAVKPLVEHVIDEPLEAGYFLSQQWNVSHQRLPTAAELAEIEPWSGWSISAFWRSVQDEGLLKIVFTPAEPNFDGPVYVVVDERSASATELATDAFRASGLATLVGERTAGEMLSQSPFDFGEGFQVSLPVADYFSATHGRIEGVGIPVAIEVPSERALDAAKALARQN